MARPVANTDTGLKVLYPPPSADTTAIDIDIVAIHGIGAHPDDAWSINVGGQDDERYVNWLQDEHMLPTAVPRARIMRYGYQSSWFGKDAIRQNASIVSDRFLAALRRGRDGLESRPLIVIAHCFGGLATLKAYLEAERYPDKWPGIYSATVGILFLGTPFRGAPGLIQAHMIHAAQCKFPDTVQPEIFRILNPEDEMLLELVDDFQYLRSRPKGKVNVACFYELKPCNIKAGPGQSFAVTQSSACLDWAEKISIQRSHFEMNKFGDPEDEDFLRICHTIRHMVVEAPTLLASRAQRR